MVFAFAQNHMNKTMNDIGMGRGCRRVVFPLTHNWEGQEKIRSEKVAKFLSAKLIRAALQAIVFNLIGR